MVLATNLAHLAQRAVGVARQPTQVAHPPAGQQDDAIPCCCCQRVDRCALREEVLYHLRHDCPGVGAHPLGSNAVVGGGQHHRSLLQAGAELAGAASQPIPGALVSPDQPTMPLPLHA